MCSVNPRSPRRPAAPAALLALLALLWLAMPAGPARAQDTTDMRAGRVPPDGPSVANAIAAAEGNHWLVGMSLDLNAGSTSALEDELLLGMSVGYRIGRYSLGGKLAFDPVEVWRAYRVGESEIERYRFLAGLHSRVAFELAGVHWLYGVGVQAEARIDDHFSLIYVTPLELGVVLWRAGSNRIQLFGGARVLVHGELINHFLIDPNGVNNETAGEALGREKDVPAEGFIGLTFARRLD